MNRSITALAAVSASLFVCVAFASTNSYQVPEKFQRFDAASNFQIKYGDVDAILNTMVVDVGRSSREKADESTAKTGTRMKTKVKRDTAKEGNRFFFEEFQKNEDYRAMLRSVRQSLEIIPEQVPLESFNRKEQLAYWLNLYNITMLDQLVQIYPERDLKKELNGKKSILEQKVLNVSGESLSLNDIQTILATNYGRDPLHLYGLYQGIVGGPNIRQKAYTAENVQRYLQDNAEEFVNSNRGTQDNDGKFEVSTYYERNANYFPDWDEDLKQHLMRYIEGPERAGLQAANTLRADINDWTVTDVYGTMNTIGGSFTDSKAAMMDAVQTQQQGPDGGASGQVSGNMSVASSMVISKTPSPNRFSPEVLTHLDALKEQVEMRNLSKEGTVTIEEMGQAEDAQSAESTEEDPED